LVDRNIVLTGHEAYWLAQRYLWSLIDQHRVWVTLFFMVLVGLLFITYFEILKQAQAGLLTGSQKKWLVGLSVASLIVSYPALSHDIYNYLFNAKMVLSYQTDPHVSVALDFPQDPWLGFMHNVHTPAPYGYGFTLISLVPSFIGQNHLKVTVLFFRLMMIFFLGLLVWLQLKLISKPGMRLFIVAFVLNPLVLIETVGNIHNDVVMMGLLFLAWYLYKRGLETAKSRYLLAAIVAFVASVSIKYASIMFLAGIGIQAIFKYSGRFVSFGGAQGIANIIPLLTARSQRFLPWYLIWSLPFLPFTTEVWLRNTLLVASLAGLLSYVPFLYWGEYTAQVLTVRSVILYTLPLGYLAYWMLLKRHKGGRTA
jgi:hypothetical protein